MSIRSVFKAASALTQGHRQGSIQGSTLPLDGAVVIDISGAVSYFFAGKKAGHQLDFDALLWAVEKE